MKVITNELKPKRDDEGFLDLVGGYLVVAFDTITDLRAMIDNRNFAYSIADAAATVLNRAVRDAGIDLNRVYQWDIGTVGRWALMVPRAWDALDCRHCGGHGRHIRRACVA